MLYEACAENVKCAVVANIITTVLMLGANLRLPLKKIIFPDITCDAETRPGVCEKTLDTALLRSA